MVDLFTGEVPELRDVPYLVLTTSRDTLKRSRSLLGTLWIDDGMEFSAEHPKQSCAFVRRSLPDVDEDAFNAACEAYRKATPRTLQFSKEQLGKTVTWMNLGAKAPITVKYEDPVAAAKN
jgi:hypothetical protein